MDRESGLALADFTGKSTGTDEIHAEGTVHARQVEPRLGRVAGRVAEVTQPIPDAGDLSVYAMGDPSNHGGVVSFTA